MDRYSRSYDERYRGYYDRPRSDTYRPAENYRSERDYRDGGRNYSPNPHYSSSRSPGHGSNSGSRGDRYSSYSDSRPYSSHYSSRGPSPSRSSSRSPRRPSYGYYRSNSSFPYNSRRSPSPVNGRSRSSSRRRESYDHRPYHGSPSYSQYPSSYRGSSGGGPYPPYSSRRHFSGPSSYSPNYGPSSSGGYHSRDPFPGHLPPPSQQAYSNPMQKSIHSTPSSTAPNSPRQQDQTIVTTTTTTPAHPSVPSPQKPLTDTSGPSHLASSPPTQSTISGTTTSAAPTASSTFSSSTTTTPLQQQPVLQSTSYSQPATYPYSTPSYSGPLRAHSGPSLHHHGSSSSNYHYTSAYHAAPPRQRVSWAPEQEKEVERYHIESRKLCEEENKILISCRKSRFELELADWEAQKLDHQLELVQKQWEENGMEELVKEEMVNLKFNNNKLVSTGSTKLMIL